MSYETLASMVRACEACPLHTQGIGVPGEFVGEGGDTLVIGEAPGGTEQHAGRPFIGSSGKLLRTMLSECGLENFYITNVAKHRPPVQKGKQSKPTADVLKACAPFLLAEWQLVAPRRVILLGSTPATTVLKLAGNTAQSKLVNRVFPFPYSKTTALVLYHPAFFLHNRTARYVQTQINNWQRALRNFLGAEIPQYPIEKVECITHGG